MATATRGSCCWRLCDFTVKPQIQQLMQIRVEHCQGKVGYRRLADSECSSFRLLKVTLGTRRNTSKHRCCAPKFDSTFKVTMTGSQCPVWMEYCRDYGNKPLACGHLSSLGLPSFNSGSSSSSPCFIQPNTDSRRRMLTDTKALLGNQETGGFKLRKAGVPQESATN